MIFRIDDMSVMLYSTECARPETRAVPHNVNRGYRATFRPSKTGGTGFVTAHITFMVSMLGQRMKRACVSNKLHLIE